MKTRQQHTFHNKPIDKKPLSKTTRAPPLLMQHGSHGLAQGQTLDPLLCVASFRWVCPLSKQTTFLCSFFLYHITINVIDQQYLPKHQNDVSTKKDKKRERKKPSSVKNPMRKAKTVSNTVFIGRVQDDYDSAFSFSSSVSNLSFSTLM